jgi:hypothetical protein
MKENAVKPRGQKPGEGIAFWSEHGDSDKLAADRHSAITAAVMMRGKKGWPRMDQDETIALFLQGTHAWNAWATGMLTRRRELVA